MEEVEWDAHVAIILWHASFRMMKCSLLYHVHPSDFPRGLNRFHDIVAGDLW